MARPQAPGGPVPGRLVAMIAPSQGTQDHNHHITHHDHTLSLVSIVICEGQVKACGNASLVINNSRHLSVTAPPILGIGTGWSGAGNIDTDVDRVRL